MALVDLPLLQRIGGVEPCADLAEFERARPDVAIGWRDPVVEDRAQQMRHRV